LFDMGKVLLEFVGEMETHDRETGYVTFWIVF
jgi:hypothetical protein